MTKLNERISQLEKEIEALKKAEQYLPLRRWKPMHDEDYYFIGDDGNVEACLWNGITKDFKRYEFGNVYKTRERANRVADKQRLIIKLRDFAGNWVPDWEDKYQPKYGFYYDSSEYEWKYAWTYIAYNPNMVYFKTADVALEAMEVFKDQLHLLWED